MKDGEKAKKIRLRFDEWWKSGSQEGKVESRQKIWRAGDKTKAHWRCDKVIMWLSYKYFGCKVTGLRVILYIWFTGTVTRWQYEKVIRRQYGMAALWPSCILLATGGWIFIQIYSVSTVCIKLHSFINDLHMYNKRYILISYQLARRNTSSEFCLHFSFSFIIYNRIFITNFFLFTYKS